MAMAGGLVDPGASSISVTVRVRPFTIREAAQITKCDDGQLFLGDGSLAGAPTPKLGQKGIRPVIKVIDDKCLVFDPPEDNPVTKFTRHVVSNMGKRVKDQTFGFDRVFDENTTQAEVYEATARGLLDSVLDGFNSTVFAYGATGCGKTHTITGTAQQPGIIFLTMQELFEKIAERSDEKHTEVSLSYLEIYNETIRDLLVPGGSKQGLMLREDAHQAVSVAGLSSHHPKDVQQVMDMIVQGNEYRTVSPTAANATSSRSHAVLQINVAQKDRNADVNEPHTMATLSIIDLAGSERASATKNRGERLLEGANINKSLLALGSCINALCDPRKKNHVPYRNSKLTRLLKFSLGGNCKTVMIVCVSPSSTHFDETQNTLRYANRAKNIQTKVTRNVYNVNRHVKDFLVKIDEQMALINELRAQQKDSEGAAFVKFKKQSEKRDGIAREGVIRIRAAFESSTSERQEKVGNMKKLRQIERRIFLLNAWIGAFDNVCDAREEGEMPSSLAKLRKHAMGVLIELESSRQHHHQKIEKANWERAVDSALQNSIRMVTEVNGAADGLDVASLTREAELLKANFGREALRDVLEVEKREEQESLQKLLNAQMDIVIGLGDIASMSESEAIEQGKSIIKRLLEVGSSSISDIVKPGTAFNASEAFPPTKRGTPKRKKPVHPSLTDSVSRPAPPPMPALALASSAPQIYTSPMKSSPRRRKAALGKKGISFTPKKSRSPSKKSGVRWRDEDEVGTLADFEKTPQKQDSTPDVSSIEQSVILPTLPSYLAEGASNDSLGSSPIPTAPVASIDIKPKSNRFEAGFLSKRSNGSPPPPTITPLGSSSNENSPLRPIENTNTRSSLHLVQTADSRPASSGSESENAAANNSWSADATKISQALKRSGSISRTSIHDSTSRTHRRKSPSAAGSPPSENALFTASHARRMVGSQKGEGWSASVLSPRGNPVVKAGAGARRTTIAGAGERQVSAGPVRLSVIGAGSMSGTPRGGSVRESTVGAFRRF